MEEMHTRPNKMLFSASHMHDVFLHKLFKNKINVGKGKVEEKYL